MGMVVVGAVSSEIGSEMGGADFGDARLTQRLVEIVQTLARAPAKRFPEVFSTRRALEGLYRFVNNARVSMQRILAPHFAETRRRAAAERAVIAAHDTTEFRFDGEEPREGLGWVDMGGAGFYGHFALLVSADEGRRPLGVMGVRTWTRQAPAGNRKTWRERYENPGKESRRWAELIDEVEFRVDGVAPVIHVMDREADAYHLLAHLFAKGRRFVIRAAYDRLLAAADPSGERKLSQAMAQAEVRFIRQVPLSKRGTKIKGRQRSPSSRRKYPPRNYRLATLAVSAAPVALNRPSDVEEALQRVLPLNVVRVYEVDCPEGIEPVEWWLLTGEPIETKEQLEAVVDAYRARWRIEEYFTALKTGCAYETRQLESLHGLLNALAVSVPVAWQLLALRTSARETSAVPATAVFTATQLDVLRATSPLALTQSPTVADAMLSVAALGGHIRNNGQPGWRVLGRGLHELLVLVRGWTAAQAATTARKTISGCAES